MHKQNSKHNFAARRYWLLFFLTVGMLALVGRTVFLQIYDHQFLRAQGDRRHISVATVPAYRGNILDRNNEPLAISSPVDSVWVDPQHFKRAKNGDLDPAMLQQLKQIATWLKVTDKKMTSLYHAKKSKRFIYLKRHINPQLAAKMKALKVPGVYFKREFKRYYPTGAVSAHVVGFTNIDDVGQEGMERGYEHTLRGISGQKRVIRDGKRRIIDDVENINDAVAGQDLILSIDQRIQYLAHRELQKAVIKHKALSASIVVLDANNGEILAVANQPAFNPNIRNQLKPHIYRNRALLDIFEPGSTVKPFVVAAALDGEYVSDSTQIDTQGVYRIGRNIVKDTHDYGTLDLTNVLKKSSNVAISKIALKMPSEYFWDIYRQLGFGATANSGFPTETTGKLLDWQLWHDFEQATLAFGYGVSMSTLQLARAYTALADDGILHSVSMLKRDNDYDTKRVFSRKTAKKIKAMLEHVVKKDGTAYQARVDGYRVAGKTGTVQKSVSGGYADDRHLAVFAGLAPVSKPRFVIAVVVNEPTNGQYYGGQVAAPVFAKVMAGALRIYEVAPDTEDTMSIILTSAQ